MRIEFCGGWPWLLRRTSGWAPTAARSRCRSKRSAFPHNQGVVFEGSAVAQNHALRIGINVHCLAQKNLGIFLLAQNAAQRSRDFSRRQRTGSDLVQQWLKEMKISPVNQGDFHWRALQLLRGSQSAKSAAENDDPMFLVHALRSPKRNLTQAGIISFSMIFSRRGSRRAYS